GAEALARRRFLFAHDRADDLHVLPHVADRLLERLAVPALHRHLVRRAKAEHRAAARHLVHGGYRLGGGHRRAGVDRHHARPKADAFGRRGVGREDRHRVTRGDVGDVHRLVSHLLGAAHSIHRTLEGAPNRDERPDGHWTWQHKPRWSARYWLVGPGGG